MANNIGILDVVEVTFGCRGAAQNGLNVLHYVCGAVAGTGATDAAAAAAVSATFAPLYKALMPTTAQYIGTRVQIIKPVRRPPVGSTAGTGDGTDGDEILPGFCTGLIKKKTNVAAKTHRGRVYVPFPSENANDSNGVPMVAYLANLQALAAQQLLQLTIGGGGNTVRLDPVVYSRKLSLYTPLANTVTSTEWATQRRRSNQHNSEPTWIP